MKVFANFFARLVFVACLVVAVAMPNVAQAYSVIQNPTDEGREIEPVKPKKKDPSCSKYKLTGEKFLDMFYAVATHGDLTDVPFIERTLKTKFDIKYSEGEDSNHKRYKRAYYSSKSLSGTPINLTLSFDVEREPDMDFPKLTMMRINNNGYNFNFINQCLAIPNTHFAQKFGGYFAEDDSSDGGEATSGVITLKGIGKDASTIKVVYGRITDSPIVDELLIKQVW